MNLLKIFCIIGKTTQDVSTFISSLKENKIMFNEDGDKEIYRSIEDKINLRNVIAFYQISQVFKFSNIRKPPIPLSNGFSLLFASLKNF